MPCCGISSDFIYRRLQSAEKEDSEKENQLIYGLLFQEGELKEPKTEEENKGGVDGRV